MNICMCGAQDGFPHDELCPFPYFGRDVKKESAWMDAWREKKARIEMAKKVKCAKCGKESQDLEMVLMMGPQGYRRYPVCKSCEAKKQQTPQSSGVSRG